MNEQNKPVYTIFAGVNGAGKSTLYSLVNNVAGADFGVRLNSDEIVAQNKDDWRDVAAQIKAGRQLLTKQKDCFDKMLSMNQETTLSGMSILRTFENAKKLGYQVNLFYVGVESDTIAKARVAERVKRGGHGVSDEALEARYVYSQENLKKIIRNCDCVSVYDNSGTVMTPVMKVEHGQLIDSAPCPWMERLLNDYILDVKKTANSIKEDVNDTALLRGAAESRVKARTATSDKSAGSVKTDKAKSDKAQK